MFKIKLLNILLLAFYIPYTLLNFNSIERFWLFINAFMIGVLICFVIMDHLLDKTIKLLEETVKDFSDAVDFAGELTKENLVLMEISKILMKIAKNG